MPATRQSGQAWYTSLTLDVFVKIINNTILQPFICCLIPLCLRAGETPWDEPAMVNSIAWAVFMVLFWIVNDIGTNYAFGAERELDHEDEVIVITGGSSGLGRCIAEIYALKGASVAVLDKTGEDDHAAVEGVNYYRCDIGNKKEVERCWKEINKDLGLPTILINNAGTVQGKPLLDLSRSEVTETFTTNALSQYHLNQLFLPPLKNRENGGTLVTVSSVLGRLGAAHLSDYAASKAALIAMHNSLAAEVAAYPKIKTILVAPGQLSTEMFGDLKLNALQRFVGPVVPVSEFAVQLVKMINDGRGGVLAEPFYARWIGALECLPWGAQKLVRSWAGVDTAMMAFKRIEGGATKTLKAENESEESLELI